jgi:nicotinamide mononucleotide (NMN) deamidase PncC
MVAGALRDSTANVAIANTGIAGPDPVDGIEPGTVCLAWGFQYAKQLFLFSSTLHLPGGRQEVRRAAAEESIRGITRFYHQVLTRDADSTLDK